MTKRERYNGFRRAAKRWAESRRLKWRAARKVQFLENVFAKWRDRLALAERELELAERATRDHYRQIEGWANDAEEFARWKRAIVTNAIKRERRAS